MVVHGWQRVYETVGRTAVRDAVHPSPAITYHETGSALPSS